MERPLCLDKKGARKYFNYVEMKRRYETLPIYEYQCTNCGKKFDLIQRITDDPLELCSFCSGKLQKLISLSNFQLKGSGWYATDYKNKKDKAEEPAEKGEKNADKKSEVSN